MKFPPISIILILMAFAGTAFAGPVSTTSSSIQRDSINDVTTTEVPPITSSRSEMPAETENISAQPDASTSSSDGSQPIFISPEAPINRSEIPSAGVQSNSDPTVSSTDQSEMPAESVTTTETPPISRSEIPAETNLQHPPPYFVLINHRNYQINSPDVNVSVENERLIINGEDRGAVPVPFGGQLYIVAPGRICFGNMGGRIIMPRSGVGFNVSAQYSVRINNQNYAMDSPFAHISIDQGNLIINGENRGPAPAGYLFIEASTTTHIGNIDRPYTITALPLDDFLDELHLNPSPEDERHLNPSPEDFYDLPLNPPADEQSDGEWEEHSNLLYGSSGNASPINDDDALTSHELNGIFYANAPPLSTLPPDQLRLLQNATVGAIVTVHDNFGRIHNVEIRQL